MKLEPYPLGIDFDGVINDFTGGCSSILKDRYGLTTPQIEDATHWDIHGWINQNEEGIKIDRSSYRQFIDEAILLLNKDVYFQPHMANLKFLWKLGQEGFLVFIITDRINTEEVGKWLYKNCVYKFVVISSKSHPYGKPGICNLLGLDGLVDDRPKNLQLVSEAKLLAVKQIRPWNKNFDPGEDESLAVYDLGAAHQRSYCCSEQCPWYTFFGDCSDRCDVE